MLNVVPIEVIEGKVKLIDQRKLPGKLEYFWCYDYRDVYYAISEMVCRGAPLIGTSAAYGVALACLEFQNLKSIDEFYRSVQAAISELSKARPTAVNLFWSLQKMDSKLKYCYDQYHVGELASLQQISDCMLDKAQELCHADVQTNYKIATHGEQVVSDKARILTHCNAGALATSGYGTALGVVRRAHELDRNIFVYVDETRPRLQGSKLTAWELSRENIPYKLIPDSVSATLIKEGYIDLILVGADRIARNGDTANKIGTFMLSVLAATYNVPFYVAAPLSTIDFDTHTGEEIVIEERSNKEVTEICDCKIAPEGAEVYNPAFDVTPADNITGIITEQGIFKSDQLVNLKND